MSFLDIKDVVLTFKNGNEKVRALENINLSISKGEFITIVGPSGCGKSSLLKLIAGVQLPTLGVITFQNEQVQHPDPKRGMMFQDATLFPWLSVKKNISFPLRMKGISKEEQLIQADIYLKLMGLTEFANNLPYQLSGGMKQRVALARTLINNPDIILMDEPLGALDAFTRKNMQSLLLQIFKETNKTFLFVTHDVEEAVKLGTRIIVLSPRPGRIVADLSLPQQKTEMVERVYNLLDKKEREISDTTKIYNECE